MSGTSALVTAPDVRPWVASMVRLGYLAKGLIYLLIGTLAFRLAVGLDGGGVTDASGAMRLVLKQPLGLPLIGAIAIGILTYSGWQIAEGLLDMRRRAQTRGVGSIAA